MAKVEQHDEEEPIDFAGFDLQHEFLSQESIVIVEDDDLARFTVLWIFEWRSSDNLAVPVDESNSPTTPSDSLIPITIFP
jgi:hypothetical protein